MSEIPVPVVEAPAPPSVQQEVAAAPVRREISQGEIKPIAEQLLKEHKEAVADWPEYEEAKVKPNENRNPYHHVDLPQGQVLAFDEENNPVGAWTRPAAKSFLLAVRNSEGRHYYEDHTRQNVDRITISNALSHPKSETYWRQVWTGGVDEVYAINVNHEEEPTYAVIHAQPNPDGTYVYEKNTQAAVDGVKAKLEYIKEIRQKMNQDRSQQESFNQNLDSMIHGAEDQEEEQQ